MTLGVIGLTILQLFAGRPSLKKLQLWTDDAKFQDNITHAEGRKQYEAQWYGLQTAFSEIERLYQSVTSSGNPITMDMKTRYKVKGIGSEQTLESVIKSEFLQFPFPRKERKRARAKICETSGVDPPESY